MSEENNPQQPVEGRTAVVFTADEKLLNEALSIMKEQGVNVNKFFDDLIEHILKDVIAKHEQ